MSVIISEVKDAIGICKAAGIRVVMITGDHKLTAVAVAKELNLMCGECQVLTGQELEVMSEEQLAQVGHVAQDRDAGGQFLLEKKVTDLIIEGDYINGIVTSGNDKFYSPYVILATGHSARDIYDICRFVLLFNLEITA